MLPDDLSRFERALRDRGRPVRVLARTESTNDDARSWASAGAPHGAVVLADAQSRGRGRHGRVWSTAPGESLALSIVLRPAVAPPSLPKIALVVGLAARRAIGARVAEAKIKWPNDVVIGDRKVAGVLVEGSLTSSGVDHVVAGVGINVAQGSFDDELASIATSLRLTGARDLDRAALALDLIDALDDELAIWMRAPSSVAERIRPHDALLGRAVVLSDESRGVADGVAEDGRLRVRVGDTLVHAVAGEVRLHSGP